MLLSRHFPRAVRVGGICILTLALTADPASATVNFGSDGSSQVYLNSDGDGDTIAVSCDGGQVSFEGNALLACAATVGIFVNGGAGNDAIDLSALQGADFPVLRQVVLEGGPDTDTIMGSFAGDIVTADEQDVVQGLGGNDFVSGGNSVFGGDGDDTMSEPSGLVDGGAGDDRIVNPAGMGPFDGGTGEDTLEVDFATGVDALDAAFLVTDTTVRLEAPDAGLSLVIPSTRIDAYDFSFLQAGTQTWDASGYSGSSQVRGLGGIDKLIGGPGEDILDGGGDNDVLTGGAGFDYIKGGLGDDHVFVRDGEVDRVNCGGGNDSVTADSVDLLTGCEAVLLLPTPPTPSPVVPVTGKVKGPKKLEQGDAAKFRFSSPTDGATFRCKLDQGSWRACKSPRKVPTKDLTASVHGSKHVLKVRAFLAGVVDATPETKKFKVYKK